MATLIGRSTATHFWVPKIGANQIGKVLRPAGTEKTRQSTFLRVYRSALPWQIFKKYFLEQTMFHELR